MVVNHHQMPDCSDSLTTTEHVDKSEKGHQLGETLCFCPSVWWCCIVVAAVVLTRKLCLRSLILCHSSKLLIIWIVEAVELYTGHWTPFLLIILFPPVC